MLTLVLEINEDELQADPVARICDALADQGYRIRQLTTDGFNHETLRIRAALDLRPALWKKILSTENQ